MKTIELGAEARSLATKGELRTLRATGKIPAVVYGTGKEPVNLVVEGKQLFQSLKGHGTNVLVNLKVGGKAETVLLKELQRDFLTHAVIHADFQRISMTDKLEVNVPLHITGEAPGVKLGGGILEHVLREVRVSCLPSDIPDGLNVDVSRLQLNQGLKIKDLAPLPGVEVLNEPESIVVNIVAPAAEEVAPVAAAAPVAAGSTEPEVIAKGKKPEEGEAAVAAPAAGAAKGKQPPAKEKK